MGPDFLVEDPEGFGILGGDDNAPGVPVNPVAQGRCESVFRPGVPLLFLIKVGLDMVDEGIHFFRFVGVDYHAGALVRQEKVSVLIHNIELGAEEGQEEVFLPGLVKEFIVDV